MPRFFLHIDDGTQRIEDEEGSELPDLTAARDEALGAARQLWAAAMLTGRDIGKGNFLIANDQDEVIASVEIDDGLPEALVKRLKGR